MDGQTDGQMDATKRIIAPALQSIKSPQSKGCAFHSPEYIGQKVVSHSVTDILYTFTPIPESYHFYCRLWNKKSSHKSCIQMGPGLAHCNSNVIFFKFFMKCYH